MSELIIAVGAGLAGGLIRAAVGILKWQTRAPTKSMKFSKRYLLSTVLLSGLLGVVAGLYIMNDARFAVLAGYAGTDFIDSLYKVRFRERYKPSNRKVKIP
ncbi:MAG: hypothetical protein AABX14_01520 [Candidatus Aenigmatarchaeota archaeon]